MRRALDWLVVDEGGRTAGVVPFTSAGMTQTDGRSLPEMYARVLETLRGRSLRQGRDEVGPASTAAAGRD